ncbi:MAG: hypothetical protein ACR2IX_07475 [Limnohabitans sp.]
MPESYLDLFWLYLGIGAITFPVLRLLVYVFHRKESPSVWAQEVMTALEKEKTLLDRVKKTFVWFGSVMLFCLIWPVALLVAAYATFFDKPAPKYRSDEPSFTCQKDSLIKQVNPLEVEAASYITDPLGRVPNLPFGHLHQGWINLLAQLEPDDQLWSFATKGWSIKPGHSPKYSKPCDVYSGFAIVRNKKVVAEFICGWD